jgi:gluconokinase
MKPPAPILVLMGVAGCGKTTVGRLLAQRLGASFFDGDEFHPPANIAKMASGQALTDADRAPWLATLNAMLLESMQRGESAVLACSALKQSYRDALAQGIDGIRFIYLKGDFDTINRRLLARKGHYMKAGMLESQFAALEEPADALTVDIHGTPEAIAEHIYRQLIG